MIQISKKNYNKIKTELKYDREISVSFYIIYI